MTILWMWLNLVEKSTCFGLRQLGREFRIYTCELGNGFEKESLTDSMEMLITLSVNKCTRVAWSLLHSEYTLLSSGTSQSLPLSVFLLLYYTFYHFLFSFRGIQKHDWTHNLWCPKGLGFNSLQFPGITVCSQNHLLGSGTMFLTSHYSSLFGRVGKTISVAPLSPQINFGKIKWAKI